MVSHIPDINRKLRLALPCIGLDGLGAGLIELKWHHFEIIYAFDVDPELASALVHLHGPQGASNLQVGRAGNILESDVTAWERVDFVIAGPPCPPFSSIGLRRQDLDQREAVFRQVTNVILHQGNLGCFGFIVEQVPGIDHLTRDRSAVGRQSYYAEWLSELRAKLPWYKIHSWPMSTSDYLPQARNRLYTVGLLSRAMIPMVMSPPPMSNDFRQRAALGDLLHKGLCPVDESCLTSQQRANLSKFKSKIVKSFQLYYASFSSARPTTSDCFAYPVACCAVDRDPEKTFETGVRIDGNLPTLRTSNELLWLVRFDEELKLVVSRGLHPIERLGLQGFRPELAAVLSKTALLRVTGNSFSVPVVVAVFGQCVAALRPLVAYEPIPRLPHRLPEEVRAMVKRQKFVNTWRELIGVMEQQLRLASNAL
jgi:site-specific DNA-cytosine methylase